MASVRPAVWIPLVGGFFFVVLASVLFLPVEDSVDGMIEDFRFSCQMECLGRFPGIVQTFSVDANETHAICNCWDSGARVLWVGAYPFSGFEYRNGSWFFG